MFMKIKFHKKTWSNFRKFGWGPSPPGGTEILTKVWGINRGWRDLSNGEKIVPLQPTCLDNRGKS